MVNLSLRCALLALIVIGAACNRHGPDTGARQAAFVRIGTDDPARAFQLVRSAPAPVVDSCYDSLFRVLNRQGALGMIGEHIGYYSKLAGDRKLARGAIAKWSGLVSNYRARYDSSNRHFDTAIRIYRSLNRKKDEAECYTGKAMNYFLMADYAETIASNYAALSLFESMADSDNIYKIRTELAVNYQRIRDPEKALRSVIPALEYHRHRADTFMIVYDLSVLSQIHIQTGNTEAALQFSLLGLTAARQIGDRVNTAAMLNTTAAVYAAQKRWKQALPLFGESLVLADSLGEDRYIPIIRQHIAQCLWNTGRMAEAEQMLQDLIADGLQKKELGIVSRANLLLSELYSADRQFEDALLAHRHHKIYADSVFNLEKERLIRELDVRYETQKKEASIASLEIGKRMDATRKTLYLATLLFSLTMAVLIIMQLAGRNKKRLLEIRTVSLELEAKKRELTHFTEGAISKSRLIDELELRLKKHEQAVSLASELQHEKDQLSILYQLRILTEADWQNFKMLFDNVHPGVISRLRTLYPGISPAEERQFLLTKLKIDNKESANMLGISAEGVKKNRYRLKKRFGLGEQDNLDAFVQHFAA